jgi:hypothetical protein
MLMKNCSARTICSILIALAFAVSGCAALDSGGVGFGSYFQTLNASGIVIHENDASRNGYLNCANTANSIIQSNPTLKGRIVCAQQPTAQSLPFSVKVHSINSPAGNETKGTSAFFSRHATKASCATEVASRKADTKWLILEDNCAGPQVKSSL